ncbi:MAG TPA: hypothetical protein VGM37_11045 [Armatimonadota bacterium]|jgi:hypothetical protein
MNEPNRSASRVALACIALAAVVMQGCAPPGTYSKVRSSVRKAAVRVLGPADRYDVSTSRDSVQRLLDGRLARVEIHGVNVRPAPGYYIDDVFVKARNVKVDRKRNTVEGADETLLTGVVKEGSFAKMLIGNIPLTDPKVTIGNDAVEVRGTYALAGAIPLEVTARGQVRMSGPQEIAFVADSVKAGPLPLPISMSKSFDFSKIYEPLVLTGVTTEPGQAVLTGTIDWSKVKP